MADLVQNDRWKRRYDPADLTSREGRSHRPRRRRQPTWTPALAHAGRQRRDRYPRWGKDKLAVLLRAHGYRVFTSLVGRIPTALKPRGLLKEPPRYPISARRQLPAPQCGAQVPGLPGPGPRDLVQVDTLDLRPRPEVVLKRFTARDAVSRWNVVKAQRRARTYRRRRRDPPRRAGN